METFPARLSRVLTDRGLSLTETANRISKITGKPYVVSTISRWLSKSNPRTPRPEALKALAEICNVSVHWLVHGEEVQGSLPSSGDQATDNTLKEQAAAYGVPFGSTSIAPIENLSTTVLIDLLIDMPGHIATTSNQTVRERFAAEANNAAKELKRRLNL